MHAIDSAVLALLVVGCGGATTDGSERCDASMGDDATVAGDVADDGFAFGDAGSGEASAARSPIVCPTVQPVQGAPCDERSNACEYGSSTNVLCNTLITCTFGQWTVVQDTRRCPPVETCPADVDAGACASINTICEFPDAGRDCVCSACGAGPPDPNGPQPRWTCLNPGNACPLGRPLIGTACGTLDAGCSYTAGGCCAGVKLACRAGVWDGFPTEVCP